MIRNEHPIDDMFERELENFSVDPPDSVWSAIDDKLNRKNRYPVLFIRLGYAAGLALIMGLTGVWYFSTQNNSNAGASKTILTQSATAVQTEYDKVSSNTIVVDTQSAEQKQVTSSPTTEQTVSSVKSVSHKQSQNKTIDKENNTVVQEAKTETLVPEEISLHTELEPNKTVAENSGTGEISTDANSSMAYMNARYMELPLTSGNLELAMKDFISQKNKDDNSSLVQEPEKLEEEKVLPGMRKWNIEAQFAPTYAYRTLSGGAQSSGYNSYESGLYTLSGGLKLNYKYNKSISFQVGLYYSQMGQVINNVYENVQGAGEYTLSAATTDASQVQNSFGTIVNNEDQTETLNSMEYTDEDSWNTITLTNQRTLVAQQKSSSDKLDGNLKFQLRYLELPVLVRYKFNQRKLNYFFTLGANTGYLFNTDVFLDTGGSKDKIGKTNGLKSFSASAIAGFGIEIPVRNRISIILEPTFKYHITTLSQSGSVSTHLYSYNFFTGISFSL